MSGLVLLDCDGVLLDYVAGFREFLKDRYGLSLAAEGPCGFDMEVWTGLPRAEIRKVINDFNGGAETGFDSLPPMPGALEGVSRLLGSGYRLQVLSSADAGGSSVRSRLKNLETIFGDVFEEVTLIGLGGSKREILSRFEPAEWVDDHLPNAIAGIGAGHRCHVIRQSHNRSLQASAPAELTWSDSLLDIHSLISPDPPPSP